MKKPELLSPAGSIKNMRYAFAYGADAIYAGQPRYSLRVKNNEFNLDNIKIGIDEAHKQNKLFFVAVNLLPHNKKIKNFLEDIKPIIQAKPDALIMADPGLILLIRENFPEQNIHLSVQANTTNYQSVKFWQSIGIKRVILSRELSLEEIKETREKCPDIELEVFVHGALCIAYSGRCLLSGYFNHRDANQGSCTNSCRWQYNVQNATENINGDVVNTEPKLALIEEKNRPGEKMPAYEDENGTYIMNSKDLRAIEHIHQLTKIGIDSLKIEGRTKSHYYVARTAQIYKKTIEDAIANKPFNKNALIELERLANRGYTDAFYTRKQTQELQNYIENYSKSNKQQVVGEILEYKNNMAFIEVKNKFIVGNTIEVILPKKCFNIKVDFIKTNKMEDLQEAKGSGYQVWIAMPIAIDAKYGFIARFLDEKMNVKSKYIAKDNNIKIRRPSW